MNYLTIAVDWVFGPKKGRFYMRRPGFGLVLAATLLATAFSGSPVVAQDNYFLKITSPEDMGQFATGVTTKITGLLQIPDARTDKESLFLRFRLFVPGDKAFVIVTEAIVPVKNPLKGKNLLPFQQSMKLPDEPGQYLLRVDCLDFEAPTYPKSLVATSSLFIKLQRLKLPNGEHHTVTIKTPTSSDTYKTGSTIVVAGTSTNNAVVTIRVRVLQAGVIV